MKRIINGPKVYRAKCHVCDCEFEYQEEDVIHNPLSGAPEDIEDFVQCPTCGRYLEHTGNNYSRTSTQVVNSDTMLL